MEITQHLKENPERILLLDSFQKIIRTVLYISTLENENELYGNILSILIQKYKLRIIEMAIINETKLLREEAMEYERHLQKIEELLWN